MINVPLDLRPYALSKLDEWIMSAFRALMMGENNEYVIQSRQGFDDVNIVIMDNQTGVEQTNSEWSNGLHQFLQLKHCRKLTPESLKAVFISNVSYFKRYGYRLYGLTGTLGSIVERNMLKDLYNVDFMNLPTHKESKRIQLAPVVRDNRDAWLSSLASQSKNILAKQRSVLIICSSIGQLDQICSHFRVHSDSALRNFQSFKYSYQKV